MTYSEALNAVRSLNREDRIRLFEEVWAEEDDRNAALTSEQRAELERRLTDLESNPDDTIPWEDVEARLRKRLHS